MPTQLNFVYTGMIQTWPVPVGITNILIRARSPRGGNSSDLPVGAAPNGGSGTEYSYNIAVAPGNTLEIFVGARGPASGGGSGGVSGSLIGGDGGGYTFLRINGVMKLVLAGGAGAGAGNIPHMGVESGSGGYCFSTGEGGAGGFRNTGGRGANLLNGGVPGQSNADGTTPTTTTATAGVTGPSGGVGAGGNGAAAVGFAAGGGSGGGNGGGGGGVGWDPIVGTNIEGQEESFPNYAAGGGGSGSSYSVYSTASDNKFLASPDADGSFLISYGPGSVPYVVDTIAVTPAPISSGGTNYGNQKALGLVNAGGGKLLAVRAGDDAGTSMTLDLISTDSQSLSVIASRNVAGVPFDAGPAFVDLIPGTTTEFMLAWVEGDVFPNNDPAISRFCRVTTAGNGANPIVVGTIVSGQADLFSAYKPGVLSCVGSNMAFWFSTNGGFRRITWANMVVSDIQPPVFYGGGLALAALRLNDTDCLVFSSDASPDRFNGGGYVRVIRYASGTYTYGPLVSLEPYWSSVMIISGSSTTTAWGLVTQAAMQKMADGRIVIFGTSDDAAHFATITVNDLTPTYIGDDCDWITNQFTPGSTAQNNRVPKMGAITDSGYVIAVVGAQLGVFRQDYGALNRWGSPLALVSVPDLNQPQQVVHLAGDTVVVASGRNSNVAYGLVTFKFSPPPPVDPLNPQPAELGLSVGYVEL